MKFPVNLILKIHTQQEYDRAKEVLQYLKEHPTSLSEDKNQVTSDLELLDGIVTKLADSSKEARVLINGQVIATGTAEDMSKRFDTERAMHQRSNIVLQEWQDGEYKPLKSRRLQKI